MSGSRGNAALLAVIAANTQSFEAALRRIQALAGQTFSTMAAQSQQFTRAMALNAVATTRVVNQLQHIRAATANMAAGMNAAGGAAGGAAGNFNRTTGALHRLNSALGQVGHSARLINFTGVLGGAAAATFAARAFVQYADAWTRVGRALEATKDIFGVQVITQERLSESAIKTRSDLESLATLYVRMAQATRGLGFSQEEVVTSAETVARALKLGSASASEQRSVLTQLSQALIKGRLDGDEFRSLMENASVIQIALAKRLNVSTGALQNMSQNGLIQVNDLMRAIIDIAPQLEAAFASTPATIGESFTNLQTSITRTIGEFNRVFNVSGAFADEAAKLDRVLSRLSGTFVGLAQVIADVQTAINQSLAGWGQFFDRVEGWNNDVNDIVKSWDEWLGMSTEVNDVIAKGDLSDTVDGRIIGATNDAAKLGLIRRDIEAELALAEAAARRRDELEAGARGNLPPNTPPPPTKKGRTPAEKFADDIAAIQARTEALRVEIATIGLSTFEQTKAEAAQRLVTEAKKAGLAITEQISAQIEREAIAYAQATAELERAEDRFESINELAEEFGRTAIDAFEGLLDGTQDLNESLAGGLRLLRRMILEAALLGQGPLAGILGGRGQGGGLGGILGGLLKGIVGGGGGSSFLGGATSMATQGVNAGLSSPTVVQLVVGPGQMFEPIVAGISGAVAVQTVRQNNKSIPALVSNRQARGI